jgi:hypothetical protein
MRVTVMYLIMNDDLVSGNLPRYDAFRNVAMQLTDE